MKAFKDKGFSRSSLAKELNVSRQSVYDWEKGNILPTKENIAKLADVLETDKDVLFHYFKARYLIKQLKELGCSVDDYEYLYDQVA